MEGLPGIPITCLVDSGTLYNRFDAKYAEYAGLDLTNAEETSRFSVGGSTYEGRFADVELTLGDMTWNAPVCFIPGWDPDFQLLGQEGFFRWFEVCFFAADEYLSLRPAEH
jgi:hypothetical protein